MLVLPQGLHIAVKLSDLMVDLIDSAGRATGGAYAHDEQDQDDQQRACAKQRRKGRGVIEVKRVTADLDHVRPNSRSISASLSST